MAINYDELDVIEVFSQIELDAVPEDFKGQIIVCSKENIIIDRKYAQPVVVTGNTHALVKNFAIVDAVGKLGLPETIYEPIPKSEDKWSRERREGKEKANGKLFFPYVQLRDHSRLVMSGCDESLSYVSVKAQDNSTAIVMGNAFLVATDEAFVSAFGNSIVELHDNATVWAYENSKIHYEKAENVTVLELETVSYQYKGDNFSPELMYETWQTETKNNSAREVVFAE